MAIAKSSGSNRSVRHKMPLVREPTAAPSLSRSGTGIILYLVILSLLAARCYSAIVAPALEFEDGPIMLGYFFHNGEPSAVFRHYAGYASVFQNAIAWLAAKGPLPLVPYIFAVVSLAITASCPFICSREWFSWWIPREADRTLIALVIAMWPLGDQLLITNLNYLQWNLLFLLLLMLFATLPTSPIKLATYCAVLVVCVFSHPLSLFALPLCIARLILARNLQQRMCLAIIVIAILVYQAVFVDRVVDVAVAMSGLFSSTYFAAKVFLSRVVFELAFGTHATLALTSKGYSYWLFTVGVGFAIVLGALVVSARKGRPERAWLVVLSVIALCLGMLWATTVVRYTGQEAHYYVDTAMAQRYFYVPKLAIAFVFLSLAVRAISPWLTRKSATTRVAIVTLLAGYVVALNLDNRGLYWTTSQEGARVAAFLDVVQENLSKARRGDVYVDEHVLVRDARYGSFDIVLNIDKHLGAHR